MAKQLSVLCNIFTFPVSRITRLGVIQIKQIRFQYSVNDDSLMTDAASLSWSLEFLELTSLSIQPHDPTLGCQ
jgi:hypothetical protein